MAVQNSERQSGLCGCVVPSLTKMMLGGGCGTLLLVVAVPPEAPPHALEGLDILTGEEGWVDGGRLILCHGMVLYFVSKIPPHG